MPVGIVLREQAIRHQARSFEGGITFGPVALTFLVGPDAALGKARVTPHFAGTDRLSRSLRFRSHRLSFLFDRLETFNNVPTLDCK
jgi:hypothetical protein